MKKLPNLMAVCVGLLSVSACVGLITAPMSMAQGGVSGKDVRVVNTTAEAVPVNVTQLPAVQIGNTPTVNVGNTPTVNVGQLPPVQVSSLPAVQIGNDESAPVPTAVRTQLVLREFVQIPFGSSVTLGPVDVSRFERIRVHLRPAGGDPHISARVWIPQGANPIPGGDFYLAELNEISNDQIIDFPGTSIMIRVFPGPNFDTNGVITVYGR